jgi:addiction module HigA family antidote
MTKKRIQPIHPGVYLKELLDELELSQYRLAHDIGVPAMRISYVVSGKRPVNAELRNRGIGPICKAASIWIQRKTLWLNRFSGKCIP